MSSFPSSILSITNPVGTNFLNNPDHAQQHTLINNDVIAVETYIGVQNSPNSSTLTYQIQNPASNGGGHVQTPATGGTGLTSFNKGDLLVGQSSSVIGKLAVGADGLALVADSTQTNGLTYKQVLTAPAIQQQQATYAQGSVISASVFAAQIAPTPSLVQGASFDIKWPQTNTSSVIALSISSITAVRIKNPDGSNPAVGAIKASVIGTVKFDAVSSVFQYSHSPDAEGLVGTLPAISGANLTNLPASGYQEYIFTSSGTFTVPRGVSSVLVDIVGGGGSGGGTTNVTGAAGGGGGGQGAFNVSSGVTPLTAMTVTVASSVVGGTAGGNGNNGNTTSFNGISKTGGSGGTGSSGTTGQAGGAAGDASAGAGGAGASTSGTGVSGGTGTGGGSGGIGGVNSGTNGGGGGGGASGIGSTGGNGGTGTGGNGVAGIYGSGGGGASNQGVGGSGGAGLVIIKVPLSQII